MLEANHAHTAPATEATSDLDGAAEALEVECRERLDEVIRYIRSESDRDPAEAPVIEHEVLTRLLVLGGRLIDILDLRTADGPNVAPPVALPEHATRHESEVPAPS